MPKSLQAEVAEMCVLIFTTPKAMDQLATRPDLIVYWIKDLCPAATEDHIIRGMNIAAELIQADLAEMADEYRRGVLVLPETALAGS